MTRRPGNVIRWTFVAAGVGAVAMAFGSQYAIYALLTNPGVLPGGQWVAWLGNAMTGLPVAAGVAILRVRCTRSIGS